VGPPLVGHAHLQEGNKGRHRSWARLPEGQGESQKRQVTRQSSVWAAQASTVR
jgi:hypothetical protein